MQEVMGHLHEFAQRVQEGLQEARWETQREILRALVKRVEIDDEAVRIVYKVDPRPFVEGPDGGRLQDRLGRDHAALRSSFLRAAQLQVFHHPGLEPLLDDPAQDRQGIQFVQKRLVCDAVETFPDVRIQCVFALAANAVENAFQGVVTGSSRSEAVGVRLEACFPLRFQGRFYQRLDTTVPHGGNS